MQIFYISPRLSDQDDPILHVIFTEDKLFR
jgi:hypothetical protein